MMFRSTWILLGCFVLACGSPQEEPANSGAEEKTTTADPLLNEDLFVSEDGGFTVNFLGEPSYEPTEVESGVGKLKMEMWVYEESVTQAFLVAYTDYPTDYVQENGADAMLEAAFKGQREPLGITSIDRNDNSTLNGHPIKEVRGSSPQWHLVSRLLLMDNRLYQVTMLRDGSYPTKQDEQAFIGSFHLLRDHGPAHVH